MSKRKTFIELQSKPDNKAVRRIVEKTKPVEFAPIDPRPENMSSIIPSPINPPTGSAVESTEKPLAEKLKTPDRQSKKTAPKSPPVESELKAVNAQSREAAEKVAQPPAAGSKQETNAPAGRLRIFQTSTPVTRTLTKFQKAAIVVRGENGKQLIELLWRDQMNEKTRDIWDFLAKKFAEAAAAEPKTNEVSIRKRDILEGSGVKSDRTFISAVYTLEDMGLIEVKRLSGNKEGNIYSLTEEGREELDNYRDSESGN